MRRNDNEEENKKEISVPSRGAIFLNVQEAALLVRAELDFRPLSGSYIS